MKKIALLSLIFLVIGFCKYAFARNDAANLAYISLNKGVYGVPFNVSLQDILKWCEDEKVNINNSTKQQVEEQAQRMVSAIKRLKNAYNNDKWRLSDTEKLLAEMVMDPSMDALEKNTVAEAYELLCTLNNPSFNYNGRIYLLDREFANGEIKTINGLQKVCTDERITQAIYSLTLSPSGSSERLLNSGLGNIKIYFYKENSGNLVSYATLAIFQDQNRAVLNKQLEAISQILSEKYGGKPYHRQDLGVPREQVNTIGGFFVPKGNAGEENTPEWNWYHLLNKQFTFGNATIWAANVALVTDSFSGDKFYVVYYNSDIAMKILGSYREAIKDFYNACLKEENSRQRQMKENF